MYACVCYRKKRSWAWTNLGSCPWTQAACTTTTVQQRCNQELPGFVSRKMYALLAPDDEAGEWGAPGKRCPMNPRLTDGEGTHAEHPTHPVTTAATTALRRAIIDFQGGARWASLLTLELRHVKMKCLRPGSLRSVSSCLRGATVYL